jgi:hypothetical protein
MNQISINILTDSNATEMVSSLMQTLTDMGCKVSLLGTTEDTDHHLTCIAARYQDEIIPTSDISPNLIPVPIEPEISIDEPPLDLPLDPEAIASLAPFFGEPVEVPTDEQPPVAGAEVYAPDEIPAVESTLPVTILTLTTNDCVNGFFSATEEISSLNVPLVKNDSDGYITFTYLGVEYYYPIALDTSKVCNTNPNLTDKSIVVILRFIDSNINHSCLLKVNQTEGDTCIIFGKDLSCLVNQTCEMEIAVPPIATTQ